MKTGNKHGHHWISDVRRLAIYLRDGMRCSYCDRPSDTLTLDHIKPRSAAGTNKNENLLTACISCNATRGNMRFGVWCSQIERDRRVLRRRTRRCLDLEIARELLDGHGTLSVAIRETTASMKVESCQT